jgi:DNA-directed RNA polymerase subunit beta'
MELDLQKASEHLQRRVLEGIQAQFPFQGKTQTLYLDKVEVKDDKHSDDIRGQQTAKVEGSTWSVPVYGHFTLKDNASGRVIHQDRVRLADIPKITSRHSYILEGKEYQVDNQWQLKKGIYTRRRNSGELESHFNTAGAKARSFDLTLNPETKVLSMQYDPSKAHWPVYQLLKTMGVDDHQLEKSWGKEVLEANKNARGANTAIDNFYKTTKKAPPPDKETAAAHFYDRMLASELRPDATELTVGKPFTHVNGEALQLATERLLKVHGGAREDDRDSLVFKDLRTAGDFAYDTINNAKTKRSILNKVNQKINNPKTTTVRDIIPLSLFNKPVAEAFKSNSASRQATQINPVEMVSSALQTTVMGLGGIQSERAITYGAKFVDPSHLGFLDPIHTPEGEKTGVTLRMPIGVTRDGKEVKIRLHNLHTGKMELVSPAQFMKVNVVLPDQVTWDERHTKPTPIGKTVRMSTMDNEIRDGKFEDATYVVPHSWQLFNMTSNLIPFLGNTSGGRASMASRQIEQAISLLHRKPPLVQVGTNPNSKSTFEQLMGRQASHESPVDGKVTAVKKDGIVVEDKGGEKHEVQIYNNYPLNDAKGVMHSTPLVEVGASVKKGQIIADTNFTEKGVLALGTNLRTAYIPFKGYNFEDGIVISKTAAKLLSSEHLQKSALPIDAETVLSKKRFHIEHPGLFKREQYAALDDEGVIRVGTTVHPGDPLVTAMKPYKLKDRTGLAAIRRTMSGGHTDKSLLWDSEFDGEVVGVHKSKDGLSVHVRTVEPMQVGDKMAGRYGNKGIVTMILPDQEMPHTKDGRPIEVALNPSGVPGRMNVGQLLETAASKIAEKTGKPYIVQNFSPNTDAIAQVKAELKEHGLSDTEELFDPVSKQSLGQVMVGPQHHLKLVHQVEKKLSVRSGLGSLHGPRESYDTNLQPMGGSGTGGQKMGTLGLYALLAHGAKANIREMQSYKSEGPDPQTNESKKWKSNHDRIWAAITTNGSYPPPKPTYAYQKFTDMLHGMGVNMEKKGNDVTLSPMTDAHILALAPKALPNPADILGSKLDKNGQPKTKAGGLFDDTLTGGHGGRRWTRIQLAEPVANPVFAKPIRHLTGLSRGDYIDIVHGEKGVTPNGHVTDTEAGITGGAGIKLLLDRIDVDKELPKARAQLSSAKGVKLDHALKRVQYLRALQELKMKPSDAYILHNVPVLPPVMRPVSLLADGNPKFHDLNQLYSDFAKTNDKLKDPILSRHLTDEGKKDLRKDFYDGVKAIMGFGEYDDSKKDKGLLKEISGSSPKRGYFQSVLVNRRQDMTMRSTIVPEPSLGLDEVGLPKHAALNLYRPFVIRKLTDMGAIQNEVQGDAFIAKESPAVWRALTKVMEERPVLLKRDPALHKHSVQAFKAIPVEGSAIKIHPLVTGGFNADFDGDTMSAYVPITREAVHEAHKMFPSNNLFSESSGKVMFQPTLESALGLYKLSLSGKETSKKYYHPDNVLDAVRKGDLEMTDVVHLNGKKTTAGRILMASALPENMRQSMLHGLDEHINGKGLDKLLTEVAKKHSDQFGETVNRLKDLGNGAAFGSVTAPQPNSAGHGFAFHKMDKTPVAVRDGTSVFIPMKAHTLSLDDFTPDVQSRKQALAPADKERDRINHSRLSQGEKDQQIITTYKKATDEMQALHQKKQDKDPNNLYTMYKAGVKPGWEQYKQMVLAPMIYSDALNREIPTPVTKSYAEGLDIGGYWTQMHGARHGAVMKVQQVSEPGAISKQLQNNMMNMLVDEHDCGTTRGISLDINEPDLHDRYLQQRFTHGKLDIPAGELLTPDLIAKIKVAKKDAHLIVRSPLKCESEKGVCQKCAGLSSSGQPQDLGTNVGVHAAHAVGERAMQLTLKSFHMGGVSEQHGSKLLSSFSRFKQLMGMQEEIPNEATIAMVGGRIEQVQPTATGVDIFIGGRKHHVGKDDAGVALHKNLHGAESMETYQPWKPPVVGLHVTAGDNLSDPNRTFVNPRHIYEATGSMEKVQNHLTNEIYNLYKDSHGNPMLKRRAVETVVKAMTDLTQVTDPGGHPDLLRGEFRPLPVVNKMNKDLLAHGQAPIEHKPVLKGIDPLPRSMQEDWMAKLQHNHLKDTLLDASATAGVSHIHGAHPIPGIVYGAEFGLTQKDSLAPGREHLKSVPAHHY